MTWRLAKALDTLRTQVNVAHPNRRKDSDGSIGNAEHSARTSDHNPDEHGVVHAIDITHDPAGGFDSYAFAELLRHNIDGRIKYVISNRRIFSGTNQDKPAWVWRPYTGSNPHDHHVHISVKYDPAHADDTRPWTIDGMAAHVDPSAEHPVLPPQTLRRGSKGADVKMLQVALHITADGDFGPATDTAVRTFQRTHGLIPDGVVGPQTWKALTHA